MASRSTDAVAPSLTIRIKAGSTVLATMGSSTLSASQLNRGWMVDVLVIGLTAGAAGSVEAQGYGLISSSTSASRVYDLENLVPITLDTTHPHSISITAQWSVAATTNTITLRQFMTEVRG